MVEISRDVATSPENVWAVLADGWSYVGWVVGAARMRDVDRGWPAVGTRLHHSVGSWPLLIDDQTLVLECERGRHLLLQAKAWPAGEARVSLDLEATTMPDGRPGCRVVMSEVPSDGPGVLMRNPLGDVLLVKRNEESLERLTWMAEGRAEGR